jgi:hypothetical protein
VSSSPSPTPRTCTDRPSWSWTRTRARCHELQVPGHFRSRTRTRSRTRSKTSGFGVPPELGVLDLCVGHESKAFERNGVGDETMVREPTRREVIPACFRAGSVTASRVRLTLRTDAGAIAARQGRNDLTSWRRRDVARVSECMQDA